MSQRPRHFWRHALLALTVGTVLALLLAEVCGRMRQIDLRSIGSSLWWQSVDVEACRVSEEPFLHYELAPGTALTKEGPWGRYRITVNAQGARGGPPSDEKPPDTLRLLCFGGSSMFGAGVSDQQTVCAYLARQLEARGATPAHVQPWNFGTNAYNLAQMAYLARARIPELQPDLVLVLLSNTGRRAFLLTPEARAGDFSAARGMDGWLHEENLPTPSGISPSLYRLGLRHSALARAWAGHLALRQHGTGPESPAGDALSRAQAALLTADCEQRHLPLLYAAIPAAFHFKPADVHPGLAEQRFFALRDERQPQAYKEVHPPPGILDEWARRIAEALVARGMVQTAVPEPGAQP
ncbi:MAG: SGNH/GDSL hydrolase family protein [Pseudomonadota bacterium]